IGVVLVLVGLVAAMFFTKTLFAKRSFYITGAGVVLAVWPILICAAFNNTAYFPSLINLQDSLTLYNSSSSLFTLTVMAYVSLAIPFVLWYIIIVWRKMSGSKAKY
ncbi:MAG: cytochrome d ubiquinol oxidase subunit II, partial [Bacteroidales bacterium]